MRAPAACALALGLALSGGAGAQTLLETRIAALEPCSGVALTTRVFGVPVRLALDRLAELRVEEAALTVTGDLAALRLRGRIGCATGSGAVAGGDAAMDVTASAEVALDACRVEALTLEASGFSGSLGNLLATGWEPLVRPSLADAATGWLEESCRDLAAP